VIKTRQLFEQVNSSFGLPLKICLVWTRGFWATWCVPCMQAMPYLQKVYEQFKEDKDVQFLVINSGSKNSLADAQGWWGNKKFSFPVYYNQDPMVGEKLGFNVITAVYIIDKAGNIRFKTIGFEGPVIERKITSAINLLKEPTL
jgi:thiol-disulfide isomerase/thioredoxin